MNLKEALGRDIDERLLSIPDGRRTITKFDPLLFAAIYLPHHLRDGAGNVSLCEFHLDLLQWATGWHKPLFRRKEHRSCFIAPRASGKSTWIFLLLPLWAAAHKHKTFVAAFSDSDTQSITHLQTFKQELETNELLRQDFPELCEPKRQSGVGRSIMHNRNQIIQSNGFIFMAKGADSAALGMKVGQTRPDVILFDDIEPGESNYSDHEAKKRKETLIADLMPLNDWAIVGMVGTTTMPNSIIDQIRKVHEFSLEYDGDPELFREALDNELRWVIDENIKPHYWPVILLNENGEERSLWPERWSLWELNNERHTRAFAKNMMNRPLSLDGGYWDEDDIDVDDAAEYGNTIVAVDPAVTTKKRSDYTGIAVLSRGSDGKIYVRHAEQVKLSSEALRDHVELIAARFGAKVMIVESNQGGDLWRQVFAGVKLKLRLTRTSEKKEIRAARAHDQYKKNQVRHVAHFPVLEEQMLAFPRVAHDDVLDAVVSGVLYFKPTGLRRVIAAQTNYLGGT